MDLQSAINSSLRNRTENKQEIKEDIAVIGVSFRLPGAENFMELKRVFESGTDCIEYPDERRKNLMKVFMEQGKKYEFSPGAYLDNIDQFDYPFFKLTKKEAELMDPYQRQFLQVAWKSFEDAGYTAKKLKGSKTGVFVGYPQKDMYFEKICEQSREDMILAGPGNITSIIASRLSYLLDLKGPSMMIDTACSSALTAVVQACQSIKNGECDSALAGGINLLIPSVVEEGEELPKIVSSSFRTRTFSEDSDGTGMGECMIAVYLKGLKEAERSHDHIYCVIRGAGINNDGNSLGLTAPNQSSQVEVMSSVWKKAGIKADEVSYIEAHGTGTVLGDPIELSSVSEALSKQTEKKQFCGIGSAKSYFGHTDSAAGLVGMLRCILSLETNTLYASTNFTSPTTKFNFIDSPLFMVTSKMDWDEVTTGKKLCGINAFGLSGTNCHVLLEQYSGYKKEKEMRAERENLFVISAKSPEAMKGLLQDYIEFLQKETKIDSLNLSYTLCQRRNIYDYRAAIKFKDINELVLKLNYLKNIVSNEKNKYMVIADELELQESSLSSQAVSDEIREKAEKFLKGEHITVAEEKPVHVISLPAYHFEDRHVWLERKVNKNEVKAEPEMKVKNMGVLAELKEITADIFGIEMDDVDEDLEFFEMGFDSITIIQLKNEILYKYDVELNLEEMFHEYNTLSKLEHVLKEEYQVHSAKEVDKVEASMTAEKKENLPGINVSAAMGKNMDPAVVSLVNRQLDIMKDQMRLLGINSEQQQENVTVLESRQKENSMIPLKKKNSTVNEKDIKESYTKRFLVKSSSSMSDSQMVFLEKFKKKYCEKFVHSKEFVQTCKQTWANSRFVQGYQENWKELSFPILADSAQGVKMTDIDENEFLDFSMGFGVNLLGYNHKLLQEEIMHAAGERVILGPVTKEAAEVSSLVSEATGAERVAFCNSGTEAVMNIIRICRGATNRNQIVVFKGSYHGTFDGVYVTENGGHTVPISIGTPQKMVENVTVLEYGADASIEYIKEHSQELAAVLIEPVQSRNPDFKPKKFVKELRKVTRENGIVFVFDEIINGFRLGLGGAQEFYGVDADMVAYGKIIGGGLPIGVYAGKAEYMDRVDGGMYSEKDRPRVMVVQTAGTFCHHPLAMTAARLMLQFLLKDDGRLQKRLNYKTAAMADYLNSYFEKNAIPFHIATGGSQFLIVSSDATLMRFVYYLMLYHNIYIWEGGTCYLSSEHTDDQIADLVITVVKCLNILNKNGCLTGECKEEVSTPDFEKIRMDVKEKLAYHTETELLDAADREKAEKLLGEKDVQYVLPLTKMQYMVLSQNLALRRGGKDIAIETFGFGEEVSEINLQKACDLVVKENPVLRASFEWRHWKNPVQIIHYGTPAAFTYLDVSSSEEECKRVKEEEQIQAIKQEGFAKKKSAIHFLLIKKGEANYSFSMIYQNSLFDGWSSNYLLASILSYYNRVKAGENVVVRADHSYIDYIMFMCTDGKKESEAFWKEEMSAFRGAQIVENSEPDNLGFEPETSMITLEREDLLKLQKAAVKCKVSLSAVLQTAFILQLGKENGRQEVLSATASYGRDYRIKGIENAVGLFTNIVPMYTVTEEFLKIDELISSVGNKVLSYMQHDNITSYEIAQYAGISAKYMNQCIDQNTVVILNFPEQNTEADQISIVEKKEEGSMNISRRVYIETGNSIRIICRYNAKRFKADEILTFIKGLKEQLYQIVEQVL